MTSLAEHHKTCQGISRPEIGYYVWFACFILPQPFSPFLEFLLLILLAFYLLPFYCLSWTLHLVEMRHKSKVYCEVELDLCPTTNLVHRAYMTVFKLCMTDFVGIEANICTVADSFCSHGNSGFYLQNCFNSFKYFEFLYRWPDSNGSCPFTSSLTSAGKSPVKGTHLFNHLNHWAGPD